MDQVDLRRIATVQKSSSSSTSSFNLNPPKTSHKSSPLRATHWLKMANPHPVKLLFPQEPFHPRNAVKSGVNGALFGAASGFIVSAVQNSLAKTNVGAWGVFSRSGSTIATLSTSSRGAVATVHTNWITNWCHSGRPCRLQLRQGRLRQPQRNRRHAERDHRLISGRCCSGSEM